MVAGRPPCHPIPLRRACQPRHPCAPLQLEALEALRARAGANGVHDLTPLTGKEVAELEPAVRCRTALLSPSTGIIDSHRCAGARWMGLALLWLCSAAR